MTEPAGYAIDPGPDTWGAARNWASTWTQVKAATPKHGTFVLVEADRGPNGPANLTQWHYFVVLNVRGTRFVVDGFLGQIETDVDGYVGRLQAVTYKFTSQAVTATPVRVAPDAQVAVKPPSTFSVAPEIQREPGEQSQRIASPTSSGIAEPAERIRLRHRVLARLEVRPVRPRERRVDDGGEDGVAADPVAAVLDGDRLGEADQRRPSRRRRGRSPARA